MPQDLNLTRRPDLPVVESLRKGLDQPMAHLSARADVAEIAQPTVPVREWLAEA